MIHPLAVEGLCVGYGAIPILQDVNLRVEPGQITALVGPNGCGKSTLLKTFARILKPQAGQVTLNGKPITDYSSREVAKQLALLPQGPGAVSPSNVIPAMVGRRYQRSRTRNASHQRV